MGDASKIEWTSATWNPVVGCQAVSPGCDHCYAATKAATRLKHLPEYQGLTFSDGRFNGTVRCLPQRLAKPLTWRSPRRIFVNSMSDLFHDQVPDEFIARVFAVMAIAHQHTFQVLTKRHARMRSLLASENFQQAVWDVCEQIAVERGHYAHVPTEGTLPLPNVWLGVSVENQQWADIRVPALLETPAAVRFLSCEPLLGPVNLRPYLWSGDKSYPPTPLSWVIVGGESGAGARPMHPWWALSLREQCADHGVPFFFKQWGEWAAVETPQLGDQWVFGEGNGQPWKPGDEGARPGRWALAPDVVMRRVGKKAAGRELDGRTWDEYPQAVSA